MLILCRCIGWATSIDQTRQHFSREIEQARWPRFQKMRIPCPHRQIHRASDESEAVGPNHQLNSHGFMYLSKVNLTLFKGIRSFCGDTLSEQQMVWSSCQVGSNRVSERVLPSICVSLVREAGSFMGVEEETAMFAVLKNFWNA